MVIINLLPPLFPHNLLVILPAPPDHLDRPVTLVTDHIHRSQIGKRHRDVVALFLIAGKDQDRVTPLLVMNQVLPVGVMLRGIGLELPKYVGVQQQISNSHSPQPPQQQSAYQT